MLTAFLVDADLAVVAAIVNTRVRFVKQDDGTRGGDAGRPEGGQGASSGDDVTGDSTHGILMELDNYTSVQGNEANYSTGK